MFYTIMTKSNLGTEILLMLLVEHTMLAKCNKELFIFRRNCRIKEQNIRHGYGIFVDEKGGKYEGQFINGKLYGKGRLVNFNGDYYEGDFKDNMLNGYGTL